MSQSETGRCPQCGHMPHEGSICLNMASDGECSVPACRGKMAPSVLRWRDSNRPAQWSTKDGYGTRHVTVAALEGGGLDIRVSNGVSYMGSHISADDARSLAEFLTEYVETR